MTWLKFHTNCVILIYSVTGVYAAPVEGADDVRMDGRV